MTGFRAFSYEFVKTFPVLSKGFEIETEMTIHALDKRFVLREIPITYRNRPEGSVSKLNTFGDGIKGTPKGDLLLHIFKRLRPLVRNLKDAQGEPLDFYETMKHTVGNYGTDDYNAVLTLE